MLAVTVHALDMRESAWFSQLQELRARRYGVAEADHVAAADGCARMPHKPHSTSSGVKAKCVHE